MQVTTRLTTVDLTPLFQKGFILGMEGEDHKKYRSILVKSIQPEAMKSSRELHRKIITDTLTYYASNQNPEPSAQQYIDAMDTIAQSILLDLFFGVECNTAFHTKLKNIYQKM